MGEGVWLCGLCSGQAHAHQRAAAWGGLGADGPALLLDDLADDREPEPGAGAPVRVGSAVEAVEYVGEIIGGDPWAVGSDGQLAGLQARSRPARRSTVLEGVVEQVGDGALKAGGPHRG